MLLPFNIHRLLKHILQCCFNVVLLLVKWSWRIWVRSVVIWPQQQGACCVHISLHYGDVIMGAIASQITSLTIVYSTVYSDADQRKHQSSASLVFAWGSHRGPVTSPHKWPVMRKMFPFYDVIIWYKVCAEIYRAKWNLYVFYLCLLFCWDSYFLLTTDKAKSRFCTYDCITAILWQWFPRHREKTPMSFVSLVELKTWPTHL